MSSQDSSSKVVKQTDEVDGGLLDIKYLFITNKETTEQPEQSTMDEEIAEQLEHAMDEETAEKLEDTTEDALDGYLPVNSEFVEGIQDGSMNLDIPELGKPIDGLNPPTRPPISKLRGIIGDCSKPFETQCAFLDLFWDGLSLPHKLVRELMKPLMTDAEASTLEKGKDGLHVTVYDSKGNGYPMVFKFWLSVIWVLTEGWTRFCNQNGFEGCKDFLTIWMFRHNQTQRLCFVIMGRRFPIYKVVKKKETLVLHSE
ncbi:hypothetical protein NMG60_11013447 [Bertholletia excelsa]